MRSTFSTCAGWPDVMDRRDRGTQSIKDRDVLYRLIIRCCCCCVCLTSNAPVLQNFGKLHSVSRCMARLFLNSTAQYNVQVTYSFIEVQSILCPSVSKRS